MREGIGMCARTMIGGIDLCNGGKGNRGTKHARALVFCETVGEGHAKSRGSWRRVHAPGTGRHGRAGRGPKRMSGSYDRVRTKES